MEDIIEKKEIINEIKKNISFIDDKEGNPEGLEQGSYRKMIGHNLIRTKGINRPIMSDHIPFKDNVDLFNDIEEIRSDIDDIQEKFLLRKIPIDITYNKYKFIIISETYNVTLPNDWDTSSLMNDVKSIITLKNKVKEYDIIQKVDEIYANNYLINRYEKDYLINFMPLSKSDVFQTQHFNLDRLTPETHQENYSKENLHNEILSVINVRLRHYLKNIFKDDYSF